LSQFNPPIQHKETDELIRIVNDPFDEWQEEARQQAENELDKRNVSKEYRQKLISDWNQDLRKANLARQQQLEKNATEGYSVFLMIYILLAAPLILLGKLRIGLSIWELKDENFRKKLRQRVLLLIGGILFWIFIISIQVNESEKKRLDEINKIDISEWRKEYYGSDTFNLSKQDSL
jgi:hypothetical protein